MKKNSSLPLILTVALVVVAAIVWIAGGVQGKELNGGALVRINAHGSYDAASVEEAVNKAGFKNPVILDSNRTAIEVQTGAMSADKLSAAADKLLSAVKATNADAELVYADSFKTTFSAPRRRVSSSSRASWSRQAAPTFRPVSAK